MVIFIVGGGFFIFKVCYDLIFVEVWENMFIKWCLVFGGNFVLDKWIFNY